MTSSGVVYDRTVKGKELTFGVSGLLHESNVLFYDHQTESLWSQLKEEAVTGTLTGTHLTALPSVTTTWKAWRTQHPDTLVLSTVTGFRRDYSRLPYQDYAASPDPMFPVKHRDVRLSPKDKVLGLSLAGAHKAYPLAVLRARRTPLEDRVGDKAIKILYDPTADSAYVLDAQSEELLPSVVAYWFAWATFHPQTEVYTLSEQKGAAISSPSGDALSRYFPLAPGNVWLFEQRSLFNGRVEATEEWVLTQQDGKRFVLTSTYRPTEGSEALGEAKEVVTQEYLTLKEDGLWKAFQPASTAEDAAFVLKLPLQVGTSWKDKQGTYTITRTGLQVELAGRTFSKCVEVTFQDNDGVFTIISLYAPGVGMIRQETVGKSMMELGMGDVGGGIGQEFRQLLVLKSWQVQDGATSVRETVERHP
ncbi:MAG: DUF3179 domain-containing protein [Deltaproteobacteria bacterium]|nr:DUF3179 domain-containing protein [Deltaproteobacteria bacterium]